MLRRASFVLLACAGVFLPLAFVLPRVPLFGKIEQREMCELCGQVRVSRRWILLGARSPSFREEPAPRLPKFSSPGSPETAHRFATLRSFEQSIQFSGALTGIEKMDIASPLASLEDSPAFAEALRGIALNDAGKASRIWAHLVTLSHRREGADLQELADLLKGGGSASAISALLLRQFAPGTRE